MIQYRIFLILWKVFPSESTKIKVGEGCHFGRDQLNLALQGVCMSLINVRWNWATWIRQIACHVEYCSCNCLSCHVSCRPEGEVCGGLYLLPYPRTCWSALNILQILNNWSSEIMCWFLLSHTVHLASFSIHSADCIVAVKRVLIELFLCISFSL